MHDRAARSDDRSSHRSLRRVFMLGTALVLVVWVAVRSDSPDAGAARPIQSKGSSERGSNELVSGEKTDHRVSASPATQELPEGHSDSQGHGIQILGRVLNEHAQPIKDVRVLIKSNVNTEVLTVDSGEGGEFAAFVPADDKGLASVEIYSGSPTRQATPYRRKIRCRDISTINPILIVNEDVCVIRGQVQYDDGGVAPYAVVTSDFMGCRSDADVNGQFEITCSIWNRSIRLECKEPATTSLYVGRAKLVISESQLASGLVEGVRLFLPRSSKDLSIIVTDAEDRPLENVRVGARGAEAGVLTDSFGRCEIRHPDLGRMWLTFTRDMYEPKTIEIEPAKQSGLVRAQMSELRVRRGRVVDAEGGPCPFALVWVSATSEGRGEIGQIQVDALGEFTFPLMPEGNTTWLFAKAATGQSGGTASHGPGEGDPVEVRVSERGVITGTTRNAGGGPVGGVALSSFRVDRAEVGQPDAFSGSDGAFELDCAVGGVVSVRASKRGYRGVSLNVKCSEAADIVLEPAGFLSGVVVDKQGVEVDSVELRVYERLDDGRTGPVTEWLRCSGGGRFSISGENLGPIGSTYDVAIRRVGSSAASQSVVHVDSRIESTATWRQVVVLD